MPHDPYKPPSSNVEVPDTERGSAIKAVVLGLAADLAGTTVVGALVVAAYGVYLGATGSTPDQAGSTMGALNYDSGLGLVVTLIGCLFSTLGGYICARIAKHAEYWLGAVMCVISIALTAFLPNEAALAETAVLTLATVAAIMIGIHLGVRKTRRGLSIARP